MRTTWPLAGVVLLFALVAVVGLAVVAVLLLMALGPWGAVLTGLVLAAGVLGLTLALRSVARASRAREV